MFKYINMQVLASKEPRMQENGLNKFRTVVSKVSSFVGNPVYEYCTLYSVHVCNCID